MKTTLTILLAAAATLTASAQIRSEVGTGALLGGLAGAVIGHNDGRHGWEGAAIGATAGAVIGSLVANSNDRAYAASYAGYNPYYRPDPYGYYGGNPVRYAPNYGPPVVYRSAPTVVYREYVSPGYYYGPRYRRPYAYYPGPRIYVNIGGGYHHRPAWRHGGYGYGYRPRHYGYGFGPRWHHRRHW